MKKKLIALVAAMVAVLPLTSAAPASAAAAGALVFECTATLVFPTSAGTGECNGGIAPSAVTGAVVGTSNVGPFVITGAGSFDATFSYAEGCVAGEPAVLGTAQGTAEVSGMAAVHNGAVTTASATLGFQWTRAGLTAAVTITGGTITFGNGGSANINTGAAVAAFVPILGQGNTCPEGVAMDALVAGAAVVAGT